MHICIKIKIKSGKRTPPEVSAEASGCNNRKISFPNGCSIKEYDVIEWLQRQLQIQLNDIAGIYTTKGKS